jgi:uncharacterized lipoprotein YddW (UPF0748 family)
MVNNTSNINASPSTKEKDKRIDNDMQNITQKTKRRAIRTHKKTVVNPGAPEGKTFIA